MAGRVDKQRALSQMRESPFFWDYVKTLETDRDAVIQQLLYEPNVTLVEALRGRARAYDEQIKAIYQNLREPTP